MEVLRSRIQPPPRHLPLRSHREPRTSTGIGLHRQNPLIVRIGSIGLEPVKPISKIRGRATLSCLTRTMSSEDSLGLEDMVEVDNGKNLLEAS